jgi:hypothetical protein
MENQKQIYAFRQMVDGELETYFATSLEGLKQEMLKFLGGFGITPTIQNPTIEEIASIFNGYFYEPVEIILP